MGFAVAEARQEEFADVLDTIQFAAEEQRRIYRLPLTPYLKQGARFTEDGVLGVGANGLRLNEYGFDQFCRLIGANSYFLQRLREPGLASRILNDVLVSGNTTKPIDNLELVCDEDSKQVVGIVSDRYVGYSNRTFIDDILSVLDGSGQKSLFPDTGDFQFLRAYSVNTRLFMRVKSKHAVGKVEGRGGQGEDLSEIGLEFSNSMAGGHAVRLAYFVHRLICANGLVAKVASGKGRLVHSGDEQKFREKLFNNTRSVLGGLDTARKMIETLGAIRFDAGKLAAHYAVKDILSVIADPETREQVQSSLRDADFPEIKNKTERDIARNADKILQLPSLIGGSEARQVFSSAWRDDASMYDFINIFTAQAKQFDHARRMQTEEKAGELADWIVNNKKRFK